MNTEHDVFYRGVANFAQVRRRMKNISLSLGAVFPDSVIRDSIDFANYPDNRHVIELYVDIAHGGGRSLCWWIDVEHVGHTWTVEASLGRDEGHGEDTAWKGNYQADTVDELFSHLSVGLRVKAPITNNQAPEKFQNPSANKTPMHASGGRLMHERRRQILRC